MDTLPYLKFMVEKSASDLFFSVGTPVHAKIQGHTAALDRRPLTSDVVRDLAYSLMTYEQVKEFESALEMNLGISQ
jgi:twitching motility protein PilU